MLIQFTTAACGGGKDDVLVSAQYVLDLLGASSAKGDASSEAAA